MHLYSCTYVYVFIHLYMHVRLTNSSLSVICLLTPTGHPLWGCMRTVRTGTPGEIDTITVFASKSTRTSIN